MFLSSALPSASAFAGIVMVLMASFQLKAYLYSLL